jgi:hypothetical protein
MPLAILLIAVCFGAPAYAGSWYVASYGDDNNSCVQTSPCRSLNAAVAIATPNDTVVCLDTVITTFITIQQSIDIDCSAARHVLRGTDLSAIFISIPVSANDPFRTVRLRGISIQGATPTAKQTKVGINIVSATVVYLEGVVISDTLQKGVFDQRTGGQTKLFITDSIIRNNAGPGIVAAAGATGIVVLDNVRSENNAYGIAVASGNNVAITRSVFSGNSVAGVEGDSGAQIVLDGSTISHNNIGVQSVSAVRLSNNNIAFNNTAISGATGTFGNNRLSGNVSAGTISTPLGGASGEFAQQ